MADQNAPLSLGNLGSAAAGPRPSSGYGQGAPIQTAYGFDIPTRGYNNPGTLSTTPRENWSAPSATTLQNMTTVGDYLVFPDVADPETSNFSPRATSLINQARQHSGMGLMNQPTPTAPSSPSGGDGLAGLLERIRAQGGNRANGGRAGFADGGTFEQSVRPFYQVVEELLGMRPEGVADNSLTPTTGDQNAVDSLRQFEQTQPTAPAAPPVSADPGGDALRALLPENLDTAFPLPPTQYATDASAMGSSLDRAGLPPEAASTLPTSIAGSPYSQLTDPDKITRLTLSEAGTADPRELAGIASTIINRVNSGEWGGTVAEAAQSRGQFEPFTTVDNHPMAAGNGPDDPRYDQTRAIVESLLTGGQELDPYTNFYAPRAQAEAGDGRAPVPSWDNGRGVDVGPTRFFDLSGSGAGGFQDPSFIGPAPTAVGLGEAPNVNAGIGADATTGTAPAQPAFDRFVMPDVTSDDEEGFANSPWLALAAGLLSALSSDSPTALGALGEGGVKGLQFLLQQRAAEGERNTREREDALKAYQADTSRFSTTEQAKQLAESAKLQRDKLNFEMDRAKLGTWNKIGVTPEGKVIESNERGETRVVDALDPATMRAREKMADFSPAELKIYNGASDVVSSAQDILTRTQQMRVLNDSAYEGAFAGGLSWVDRQLVGSEALQATTDLENLAKLITAGSLKSTFPGAISDAERKYIDALQALPSYSAEERRRIIERGILATENVIRRNAAKMEAMSSGAFDTKEFTTAMQAAEREQSNMLVAFTKAQQEGKNLDQFLAEWHAGQTGAAPGVAAPVAAPATAPPKFKYDANGNPVQ